MSSDYGSVLIFVEGGCLWVEDGAGTARMAIPQEGLDLSQKMIVRQIFTTFCSHCLDMEDIVCGLFGCAGDNCFGYTGCSLVYCA